MSPFEREFQAALQHFFAGRLNEAGMVAQQLLKMYPTNPGLLQLLGEIAMRRGDLNSAVNLLNEAIARSPQDPHAHYRFGNTLLAMRKLDSAAYHYYQALELKPDYWQASANLGLLWRSKGCFQEARQHFESSLKRQPNSIAIFCYFLDSLLSLGEFRTINEMTVKIKSVIESCISNDQEREFAALMYLSPFIPMSKQDFDSLAHKIDSFMNKGIMKPMSSPFREKHKLRIGYVSPDFGDHPISHVMRGLFGQHDRGKFTIIAYSMTSRTGTVDQDYIKRIQLDCENYIDLSGLTVYQAAERIAADDVQILVNLSGYMCPQSLEIFAMRPAPIQVYWLGHGGGLGLSCIDYVIADTVVIPPGEEISFREKVVRLPESYHCADTPAIPNAEQSRAEHGLQQDAFVFCAFNNPNKIDREVFDAWMNILHRVPDSQIWLSNPTGDNALEHNLRAEAQQRGISPARLVFATRMPNKSLHLARHRLANLFLDTFRYTAATTAIDALWAGLPIVTRRGNNFFSRICATLVTNIGLSDMICNSIQEYEDRAVYFANDNSALSAVRARLAQNVHTEPLFDIQRFCRHLEDAYLAMWQHHTSGKALASINVPARPRTGM